MDSLSSLSLLQKDSTPMEQSFQNFVHKIHRYEEEMQVLQKEIDMLDKCISKIQRFSHMKNENIKSPIHKLCFDRQERANSITMIQKDREKLVFYIYTELCSLVNDMQIQFQLNQIEYPRSFDGTINQCKHLLSLVETHLEKNKHTTHELKRIIPECRHKCVSGFDVHGMDVELIEQKVSNDTIINDFEIRLQHIFKCKMDH